MRVNFRNKKLDIKNEMDTKSSFTVHWNGYIVEVIPFETQYFSDGKRKTVYEAYCVNTLGHFICDNTECNSISEGIQSCFDSISEDINDLQKKYNQIEELLENIKDWL